MRDEVEKPMVRSMEQQTRQPKKAPKTPEFVKSDEESSDDSYDEESDDPDNDEPMVKRIQTLPKKVPTNPDEEPVVKQFQEMIEAELEGPRDDEEDPQKASPESVNKVPIQLTKKGFATSRTSVASCTYILTSGIRKGKQYKLKASDKTGKLCHLHNRQT